LYDSAAYHLVEHTEPLTSSLASKPAWKGGRTHSGVFGRQWRGLKEEEEEEEEEERFHG
jgi:hypothetical protein